MMRRGSVTLCLLLLGFSVACGSTETAVPEAAASPVGIANPASVFCEANGGRLEIRTGLDGGQVGACVFPAGSECEEWAYFRGECQPGTSPATPESATAQAVSAAWNVYHSEVFGYSFHYPSEAQIEFIDDPLRSVSITGPELDGERWPQLTISHPSDRQDFRPPEGTDLAQWLTDHYLFGDERMPDAHIAGTTAIHLRHERSPQTYANDRYYFARAGQLYMVIINHAGDKEDWELYDRFLDSFVFDS